MSSPASIQIRAQITKEFGEILTNDALAFLGSLEERFGERRLELLARRAKVQAEIDGGKFPDFLAETRALREGNWTIASVPPDLQDRRVEITGPVERKMVINALNSGAKVFMADFEDSHAPTWSGTIQGQINLRDAVNRGIEFKSPEGKEYRLNKTTATLMVRPRGWHLVEAHATLQGRPMSGSLFDFGLFFFHNAKKLVANGTGPYFYLPKMESHLEARLWNDVFVYAQKNLGIPNGTIKATVLIETILGAFEMDEILHELKDHSAGLNCGRWDYIFSFIKKFRNNPDFVVPDRVRVTMREHFLKSYSELLIQTCHRRKAHAMGGMAAQIPIKDDPKANEEAIAKVRADKEREVSWGHDGTWVAHPGLVSVAREIFDAHLKGPNQLSVKREDVHVTAKDLLTVPKGPITEVGLRTNISVGLQYIESWLRGNGCVPIFNLMEDAATAEISRAQIWQWIRHPKGVLDDGRKITMELFTAILGEELGKLKSQVGEKRFAESKFAKASEYFASISIGREFPEFLTLKAYDFIKET